MRCRMSTRFFCPCALLTPNKKPTCGSWRIKSTSSSVSVSSYASLGMAAENCAYVITPANKSSASSITRCLESVIGLSEGTPMGSYKLRYGMFGYAFSASGPGSTDFPASKHSSSPFCTARRRPGKKTARAAGILARDSPDRSPAHAGRPRRPQNAWRSSAGRRSVPPAPSAALAPH